MKTKEELNELKKEVEALNRKLAELSAEVFSKRKKSDVHFMTNLGMKSIDQYATCP